MSVITSQSNAARTPSLLRSMRDELSLFQEESHFFQRMLRRLKNKPQHGSLQEELQQFRQETLPGLQRALRSLEGQNANVSRADNGSSHLLIFRERLEQARLQFNALKRIALRELNDRNLPVAIW